MGNEDPERHLASGVVADDLHDQDDGKSKSPKHDDPFGSEEVAEVKYRTMKWWYVITPSTDRSIGIMEV